MLSSPDRLPEEPAALKAIIVAQREEMARMTAAARAYEVLVQALKIRIARLQRQKFGPSSEKIEREIEQLQLALEDLEVAMVLAGAPITSDDTDIEPEAELERPPQRRRGKPRVADHTPRERIVLDPGDRCPDCGGTLRLVGEDVSEILDFIAAKLKVVETARLKKSCRSCEKIVQPCAPTRPIRRGMIGQGVATRRPLSGLIKSEIMRADRLHVDDTPIKVLDLSRRTADPMTRGVKEGRIWVYVRDDRPWGGTDPPGTAYYLSLIH